MLDIPKKKYLLPEKLRFFACTENPAPETWGGGIPRGFVPLEKSMWPTEVMESITQTFRAIGVPDPMKQKLVHPAACCFGGKMMDNVLDLSGVDWEAVIDYYQYEAAAWMEEWGEVDKLQKAALEKYGCEFSHVAVYDIY